MKDFQNIWNLTLVACTTMSTWDSDDKYLQRKHPGYVLLPLGLELVFPAKASKSFCLSQPSVLNPGDNLPKIVLETVMTPRLSLNLNENLCLISIYCFVYLIIYCKICRSALGSSKAWMSFAKNLKK